MSKIEIYSLILLVLSLFLLLFSTYCRKKLTISKNLFIASASMSSFMLAFTILSLVLFKIVVPIGTTKFTLSDGDKTIVFQGVIHRGTNKYYKKIHDDIASKRNDSYAIVREGINFQSFSSYKNIDSCDISSNKNIIVQPVCIGKLSDSDYNFDINKSDIELYFGDKFTSVEFMTKTEKEVSSRKEGTDTAIVSNALVLLSLKSLLNNGKIGNGEIENQELVIDIRDQSLYSGISMMDDKKIYILYGLAHFSGFFDKLKASNPKWKIVKKEFIF